MNTIYDAKILIVETTPICWHCCVSSCAAQAMGRSAQHKAAGAHAPPLRPGSRS